MGTRAVRRAVPWRGGGGSWEFVTFLGKVFTGGSAKKQRLPSAFAVLVVPHIWFLIHSFTPVLVITLSAVVSR
jgi:hypothetical protein